MTKPAADDKAKISQRKEPKQARSKDLVESVIQAATRILDSVGFDDLTTSKVAERAGVSIGSLYQYFPGKDAIFSTLIERHMETRAAYYRQMIADKGTMQAEELIAYFVNELVDFAFEKRSFLSSLFAVIPKLKKTREHLYKRNEIISIVTEFLRTRASELRDPKSIDEQMYIVTNAGIGVLQTSVLENFETHSPAVLKTQLTQLFTAYLLK